MQNLFFDVIVIHIHNVFRFTKVELAPGDNTVVQWTLSAAEDLKYIGIDGRYVLESGNYYVGVGPMTDCRANASETLCEAFELALSSDYNAVCSKACDMWSNGVCGDTVDEDVCAKQCREENWEWNYVDCLEDTMSGILSVTLGCRCPVTLLYMYQGVVRTGSATMRSHYKMCQAYITTTRIAETTSSTTLMMI